MEPTAGRWRVVIRAVAVHGVGNHDRSRPPGQAAAHLAGVWKAALQRQMPAAESLDLRMTYWAPLLRTGTPTAQAALDGGTALELLQRHDPVALELATEWLDVLELEQVTAQGRLTVPLRLAVDLAARRFSLDGRLTRLFVALFFPEVARYLAGDPADRQAARDLLADTVREHRPQIVIAHSLGSVIAYEALHAHPGLAVDLLLTIGSPLALPNAVFQRLEPVPVNGRGTRPPGVSRWVNVSDVGDPIAIPRPFTDWFDHVETFTESVSLFDFHRAVTYLGSASVAATLSPILTR